MEKQKRQRRSLLFLPLLVIPFLTMGFWALGGGKGQVDQPDQTKEAGLNITLPPAPEKESDFLNKLSFYERAQKDSQKRAEWINNDPYYQQEAIAVNHPEQEIYQTLSRLQEINSHPARVPQPPPPVLSLPPKTVTADPELEKLEGMLDKILEIQQPSRVKEFIAPREVTQTNVHTVSASGEDEAGFYSLNSEAIRGEAAALQAVVHGDQTLVEGSLVKLRLLTEMHIGNFVVPAQNFIYGIASLQNERLQIKIHSIRSANQLFSVNLEVYDLDGLAGIHIPGALIRDVAKQSADQSIQLMDLPGLDPSLKARATQMGLHATKNFLSKKTKLQKVEVKGGHKLYLQNKNA